MSTSNPHWTYTLPARPEQAYVPIGVGLLFFVAIASVGFSAYGGEAPSGPTDPLVHLLVAVYLAAFVGFAYISFDQAMALRRPTTVSIDPIARTLHVPTYPSFGERPNGTVVIPLDDVLGVTARATSLKGRTRGLVFITRHSDAPSVSVPGGARGPLEDLERFAAALEAGIERARALGPGA